MLCEAARFAGEGPGGLLLTWGLLTALALPTILGISAAVFRAWYYSPRYEQWRTKSNPCYPEPAKVRSEVLLTLQCGALSVLPAALALHLAHQGRSKAYCGLGARGWGYELGAAAAVLLLSDFFEWAYHFAGHSLPSLWKRHRHHHAFSNPSPFAVIADDHLDQAVRALPLLVFPLLVPVNMDVLFGTYALFFYAYGAYLHWGHELEWPDAHHPVLNTAYQHYFHHSKASAGRPYHTGFFIKLWDELAGSDQTAVEWRAGECRCAKCCCARGERSLKRWKEVHKPDYSVLLSPAFWVHGREAPGAEAAAAAERGDTAGATTPASPRRRSARLAAAAKERAR